MKPKTFTYNQMIQFFTENKLPLTNQQIHLIGTKVREEMQKLEDYRAKKKAKADKKFLDRGKKRDEKINP